MCGVVAMFDKILVPTDGSTGMNRVIQQASGLADVHDAELHFIYAIHTASFTNLSMETSWESVGMIVQEDGELGLALAHPQEEDHVIERNGEPVIIVPQPLMDPLAGITLDYVENEEHQGFTLDRQDGEPVADES